MLFYFITLLAFLLSLNKEANVWLQWKHQGSLLTKILSEGLCSKVIKCILVAVFLTGLAFIKKSYLTPVNSSEVKDVWNTISRLHPFHILNIQGGDSKRPTKRKQGKQYIIYK